MYVFSPKVRKLVYYQLSLFQDISRVPNHHTPIHGSSKYYDYDMNMTGDPQPWMDSSSPCPITSKR